ncbi:ankyrin repeat and SOCS box protein 18 [Cricetulus griseus]|nr:ankyrin repeat and SOCS box protein 18 [Cricetulus griseus]
MERETPIAEPDVPQQPRHWPPGLQMVAISPADQSVEESKGNSQRLHYKKKWAFEEMDVLSLTENRAVYTSVQASRGTPNLLLLPNILQPSHQRLRPKKLGSPLEKFLRMYNKMWHQTQEALNTLLDKEIQKMTEPQRNKVLVFQMLATFYIKYVQIFRSMENVYDQIVHPQKRTLIRKILDGVMGRILELKNEMVELELTEFHYFDDILQDLKLAPQQLDVPIPRYFLKERLEVIKGREKILARILKECGLNLPDVKYAVKSIALEEAIKMIQIAERARQGRLRALFMKQIFLQECRAKEIKLLGQRLADTGMAALQIQKVWRGFHQSKKTVREREEEMVFLGMTLKSYMWQFAYPGDSRETRYTRGNKHDPPALEKRLFAANTKPPPLFNEVSAAIVQSEKVTRLRNEVQMKHEQSYQEALVNIKEDLKLMEGPDIKEHLQDQIRQWFIECRNLTGTFPEYPDEEEGGSAIIFSNKTPEQVIEDILTNQEEEEKLKKKKKKEEKERRERRLKKGKREKERKTTKEKKDFDPEMIKEEKRKELELEIRVQVDELMRQELKKLKLAVNKEIELPIKGKKGKKGKGKKGKKRGRRGKKDKDLTADRTIESLYRELVEEGLLIQALKVNLSDYIGEYSYLGTTLRQVAIEPMPSLLDVRQLITLYGILPLGSAEVHEKAPLVKSLLLAGPPGVGKKMLVHAICTETGANLFNLSSSNIAGKYPGKNGLQMMLHLVFKVARQLQPSVVWIQDTEKTFYKKVPQSEKPNEPKRLKKHLPKILKLLRPDDRILIVGTTQRPFDAELQSFCRVYQKIILVPRPDYASRYGKYSKAFRVAPGWPLGAYVSHRATVFFIASQTGRTEGRLAVLWKQIILRNGGVLTNALNISCLSKVTDGFTQGQIVKVVKEVLTDRRVRQQSHKPLTAVEFITIMTTMNPVYREEEESFKNWYAKTPLGKKRIMSLSNNGNKEKEKDKGKKKGKRGKKKKDTTMSSWDSPPDYPLSSDLVGRLKSALATGDNDTVQELICTEVEPVDAVIELANDDWMKEPSAQLPTGALLGLWTLEYKRELTTPLCIAAAHGHEFSVRHLLSRNADPDASPGGRAALHEACLGGHTACTQLLLQHGADPDLLSAEGLAPLHLCRTPASLGCAQALLEHGATVQLECGPGRDTPLHVAAQHGLDEHAQLYLDSGARVDARNGRGETALSAACGTATRSPDEHARCLRLCALLLRGGAAADARDEDERSPPPKACERAQHSQRQSTQLKSDGGAAAARDEDERSPLHKACGRARPSLCTLLLLHGADAGALDYGGASPLARALQTATCAPPAAPQRTVQALLNLGSPLVWPDAFPKVLRTCAQVPAVIEVLFNSYTQLCVSESWQEAIPEEVYQMHERFYRSFFALAHTPRCLQHLCRCAIRKLLGKKCFHLVPQLPLPETLQNYLLLEPEGVLH